MPSEVLTFSLGQTFIKTYPPEAASWCNENSAHMARTVDNGVVSYVITANRAPSLDELKASALKRVDEATSAAILAGFDYEIAEERLHFSFDAFDQQNFSSAANVAILAQSGTPGLPTSVTWNAYRNYTPETGGELVRLALTAADFLTLYVAGAMQHKAAAMELGGQRKASVDACGNADELQALLVTWGL